MRRTWLVVTILAAGAAAQGIKWWQLDGVQSADTLYPRARGAVIGRRDSTWALVAADTIAGRLDGVADSSRAAWLADSSRVAGRADSTGRCWLADSSIVAGRADSAAKCWLADSGLVAWRSWRSDSSRVAVFSWLHPAPDTLAWGVVGWKTIIVPNGEIVETGLLGATSCIVLAKQTGSNNVALYLTSYDKTVLISQVGVMFAQASTAGKIALYWSGTSLVVNNRTGEDVTVRLLAIGPEIEQ